MKAFCKECKYLGSHTWNRRFGDSFDYVTDYYCIHSACFRIKKSSSILSRLNSTTSRIQNCQTLNRDNNCEYYERKRWYHLRNPFWKAPINIRQAKVVGGK